MMHAMTPWAGPAWHLLFMGSAVLANPALVTRAKPDDNVSIIFPSAGIQVTDEDKLLDKFDDITDTVDRYRTVLGNFTAADFFRGYPELRAASGDLRGNKADGSADAAVAVTIPNENLPFAFITKAYGMAHVRANVVQGNIDYLRGIENGVLPRPGDQNNLRSSANGLAALVIGYGVVAHEFTIAGQPVSLGVTPKLQKT